jgi:hypothetical protein
MFAGQKVRSNKKGDVELGDVGVQVFFTTVTVKFIDAAGKPLLTREDWEHTWIKLRTAGGAVASETSLSKKNIASAVRAEETAIAMELPEGEWQIEVRPGWKGSHWLRADQLVVVPRAALPFSLTLQMAKNNKPARR